MQSLWTTCITVAWLTSVEAIGQSLQFMPFVSRAPTSLVGETGHTGSATGGDLDGDGRVDLVLPFASGTGVYRRTPFGWSPSFVQSTFHRPVLVDLDGDGDLDLACVPPHLSQQTTVLLYQNQQGTLTPVVLPAALFGVLLQGVAVGDIDGNGFADLVIAVRPGSVTPSIILARGGPGLQFTLDQTSVPAGLPYGLWPELLDADGDGDLDVLASNATSGYRLLRNVGGSFVDATSTLPAARTGSTALCCADFDGDGHTDCAATLANGDLDMLWGGAAGFTFSLAVANVPYLQSQWPGDFDGDGDLDVLAWHLTGLDVLWNQGNRQFTRAGLVAQPTTMRGVVDVDADGRADVLFTIGMAQVRCLYQARHEDAAFVLGLRPISGQTPPLPGDVDGDGRTDIVHVGPNLVTVDRALGGGAYQRATSSPTLPGTIGPWYSQLADLDGDGDLDLAVKTDVSVTVVTNGGGAFAASQLLASISTASDNMRLGDVDGDGDLDLVVAEGRGVVLFRNLGAMAFAPAAVVVPPNPAPRCVELADVDGDGDLDIVSDVVAASGLTHVIVGNDGTGLFAPHPGFYVNLGAAPTSVRAGDFDGDGDADLAVVDGTPRVFRNDGSGLFADRTPFDLPANLRTCSSNLVVADLDEDGDPDLAAFADGIPQIQLLLDDGTGTFVDRSAQRVLNGLTGPLNTLALRGADFDGDGGVDLLANSAAIVLSNHVRQCVSTGPPRLGGSVELRLLSGPGFGSPGLGLLGVGFALAAPPLALPGLAGRLQLDPATLQVVGGVATSPIGVSSVFVGVPPDPVLMGLEVWFQGAIWPSVGRPGFTNAVYEIVVG